MPTDHIEPKQKDFKLLIRLPPVCCALAEPLPQEIAQFLPQLFAKYAVGDRDKPSEIFILLDRKWSVGIAHPTSSKLPSSGNRSRSRVRSGDICRCEGQVYGLWF